MHVQCLIAIEVFNVISDASAAAYINAKTVSSYVASCDIKLDHVPVCGIDWNVLFFNACNL